jgi:hypothetical protein
LIDDRLFPADNISAVNRSSNFMAATSRVHARLDENINRDEERDTFGREDTSPM